VLEKFGLRTYHSAGLRQFTAAAAAAALVSSCATTVTGNPTSPLSDPFNVAGMHAVGGPSGLRPNAPGASRPVSNTDGGQFDRVAAQSISDIEDFWKSNYRNTFPGEFEPVRELFSWDSEATSGTFCGMDTAELINAAFCYDDNTIGWDRGVLLPALSQARGDMAITTVLAHEYGHAIQQMASINPENVASIVREQQADCFAGVYLRWVVEGTSSRFTLNTSDGLNGVLAAMLALRDPPRFMGQRPDGAEHGSAFERISALQNGFTSGASDCVAIDLAEIKQRRGTLPQRLPADQSGETPVSDVSVRIAIEAMSVLFPLKRQPQLTFNPSQALSCPDARPSPPASYCPATNTIVADIPGLREIGTPSKKLSGRGLQGDNTAYSALISRYMVAWQHERDGLSLNNAPAGLRTACLTGVATTKLSKSTTTPSGNTFALAAGDIDEAVAGLLTNGVVASDVNGDSVPAGFSRIDAFRAGVTGYEDYCIQRFP